MGRTKVIVLDTHAWIWLMEGDKRMNKKAILAKLKTNIASRTIFVSEISGWETGMLVSKNRLAVTGTLLDWLRDSYKAPGIHPCHLSPEVIAESMHLPDHFHGDPADRIIVATARVLNAELITKDESIIKYSKKGNVKVIPL